MVEALNKSSLPGIALVVCSFIAIQSGKASENLRTVALSGHAAPGVGGGITFSGFSLGVAPRLNNRGQVVFTALIAGPGVNNSNGNVLYSEGQGQGLSLVGRAGDAVPGLNPGILGPNFELPQINNRGETEFLNRQAIFRFSDAENGALKLLVQKGDVISSLGADIHLDGIGHVLFSDQNQAVFFGSLGGTGIDRTNAGAIFKLSGSGELAPFVRGGDVAPVSEQGLVFEGYFSSIAINGKGETAFEAGLLPTGADNSYGWGIFTEGGGNGLSLIARSGDQAPGTKAGVLFRIFLADLDISDSGHTAFSSLLTGVDVNASNDTGVFVKRTDSGLTLLAREGDPVPGMDPEMKFGNIVWSQISNQGETAFVSALTGPEVDNSNNIAIFKNAVGTGLTLIAREGEQAPGTGVGVRFSTLGFSLALNANGQVAFLAGLNGAGVNSTNEFGIFAQDTAGNLRLIARAGDKINVSNDPSQPDVRTIQGLITCDVCEPGYSDSLRFTMNDRGQLAFYAAFTDGTYGIFVSNLVAIPEPTSFVLLAVAAIATCTRARYRKEVSGAIVRNGGASNTPDDEGMADSHLRNFRIGF
jgi:hypothetical protein